jgi:low temperature requirement protein LtrA
LRPVRDRAPHYAADVSSQTVARFKRWFWRPPRVHGELILDRRVTSLELFYDLIYVVVIAQATSRLATDISATNAVEFAIVFGLIWIAWVNGSIYLELHGNEDGRTRTLVFVQMGVLALLAVYTAQAPDVTGQAFALIYSAFLLVMTWAWLMVRRQDRVSSPEFLPVTGRYVQLMVASLAIILVSAFVPIELRLAIWTAYTTAWVLALLVLDRRRQVGLPVAIAVTDSLVERFNLFTIIVLGEFVFDVVQGLSIADRDAVTVVTGTLALSVGFGLWWVYFDLVGNRLPNGGHPLVNWVLSHLPMTFSVAAAGAAMVALIEHAHDPTTSAETAWLLSGAVATGLVAQIVAARALIDADRLAASYRPIMLAMGVAAIVAVAAGWLTPAPWILALTMAAILLVLWIVAVGLFIRADAWGSSSAH